VFLLPDFFDIIELKRNEHATRVSFGIAVLTFKNSAAGYPFRFIHFSFLSTVSKSRINCEEYEKKTLPP
jgi:hypothetical protein